MNRLSFCRLVAHLFEHETISPKEWERLPQLIDEEQEP